MSERLLAVSFENIADEMIQQYIEEHEGEPVSADNSRFQIDPSWSHEGLFS